MNTDEWTAIKCLQKRVYDLEIWNRFLREDVVRLNQTDERLKADVARLTSAGDGLDDASQFYFQLLPTLLNEIQAKAFLKGRKASREWHAAKGGLKS